MGNVSPLSSRVGTGAIRWSSFILFWFQPIYLFQVTLKHWRTLDLITSNSHYLTGAVSKTNIFQRTLFLKNICVFSPSIYIFFVWKWKLHMTKTFLLDFFLQGLGGYWQQNVIKYIIEDFSEQSLTRTVTHWLRISAILFSISFRSSFLELRSCPTLRSSAWNTFFFKLLILLSSNTPSTQHQRLKIQHNWCLFYESPPLLISLLVCAPFFLNSFA